MKPVAELLNANAAHGRMLAIVSEIEVTSDWIDNAQRALEEDHSFFVPTELAAADPRYIIELRRSYLWLLRKTLETYSPPETLKWQ